MSTPARIAPQAQPTTHSQPIAQVAAAGREAVPVLTSSSGYSHKLPSRENDGRLLAWPPHTPHPTRLRAPAGMTIPLHQAAMTQEEQARSLGSTGTTLPLHALAHRAALPPGIRAGLPNAALPGPPALSLPRLCSRS